MNSAISRLQNALDIKYCCIGEETLKTEKLNITKKNIGLLKRYLPYLAREKKMLALDLFCAALTSLCELALPLLVRDITGAAIDDLASLTVAHVLRVAAFYVFLRIVDAGASYFMAYGGHVMGSKIETAMRNDLFSHLQELSFSFYDNTKIGQLMSRITSDLFDITEFSHHMPEQMFVAGIKIIGCFAIFANINLSFTLIIFAIFPLMLLLTRRNRHKMRAAFKDSRHQLGEINSATEDSLLGIRVVKSFANEDIEKEKFDEGSGKFLKIKRRSYRHMGGFQTTTRVFDGLMYIAVLTIGALFMIDKKISPADLTAYLLMITTLMSTVRRIVDFSEQFSRGITGIERFSEIMDELGEVKDTPDSVELTEVKGDIRFDDVTFKYSDIGDTVLSHINIHICPGESVAVVGPSGGGKTTLCNLIPRFYEVSGGTILIDGTDIRKYTLSSLRSHIGVVQQDVYMFSGSVFENISYGKPGATHDEVVEAAKKAGADEFISALPNGYDTYVGERGVKLSGGQKQRISIARVFLKNPPIIILDEATSALDNESERLVQQSLERLSEGRTTLTIAHRLTTVRNADRVLVLTQDGIAEQGTHNELMLADGIYAEMYKMYSV